MIALDGILIRVYDEKRRKSPDAVPVVGDPGNGATMDSSLPLRGLIFDLDGTLADTLPVCYAAFHATFHRFTPEQTFTDAQIAALFGPDEEGVLRQVLPQEHWAPALTVFLEEYAAAHTICPGPFPGVKEVLDLLLKRDVPIAVVTGKGARSAAISLERLGLADVFPLIEAGSPEGAIKPQAIRKVLDIWGLSPDLFAQVAYLGDAPSDVTAARTVGVTPLSAAWASTADRDALAAMRPAALFPTVDDFAAWVRDGKSPL
jgi:phosphoglycolate phosphatase-like HAD superfamily hydrolase